MRLIPTNIQLMTPDGQLMHAYNGHMGIRSSQAFLQEPGAFSQLARVFFRNFGISQKKQRADILYPFVAKLPELNGNGTIQNGLS